MNIPFASNGSIGIGQMIGIAPGPGPGALNFVILDRRLIKIAIPNTGGRKMRKKRRIRKKFNRRYGYRIEERMERQIKKGSVMQLGDRLLIDREDWDQLRSIKWPPEGLC